MRLTGTVRVALLIALVQASGPEQAAATESTPPPTVLLLVSLRSTAAQETEAAFRDTLETGLGMPVDLHVEYLDLPDASVAPHTRRLAELLREKYQDRRVDVVVAQRPEALQFLFQNRPALFPDAPVVFFDVFRRTVEAMRLPPNATGSYVVLEGQRTVSVALQLHPGARRVMLVSGSSPLDRDAEGFFRKLVEAQAPGLEALSLGGLPLDEQLRRLADLPADSVVIFVYYRADSRGRSMVARSVLDLVTRASAAPVYAASETFMGHGIVGGDMERPTLNAERVARLTLRILRGEAASSIPPLEEPSRQLMFDWRQLQRWGIDEQRLPAGSVVLFREKTLWSEYRGRILGVIGLLVAQGALIAALLVARHSRVRAQAGLREAEERYRTVADFTHDWEYWRTPDETFAYVSPSCLRVTGYEAAEFYRRPSLLNDIVVAEDRPRWEAHATAALAASGAPGLDLRIRTADGQVRWIEHVCSRVTGADGSFLGLRGSNRDVTDKKRQEQELRTALAEIERLRERLEADNTYLREQVEPAAGSFGIIGKSDVLRYVLSKVEQVAPTTSTVLLQGETGVGKELVAHAIHNLSPRRARPLVKLNCAALPPSLVESELFGHEKGAFTGAIAQRKGRFEIADGSTLFLDEIGELPLELQAKLLRVIQDGEFERVGGTATLKTDVRLVAATNRRLDEEVKAGSLPRGPLVPAQRVPDHDAAAAPAARGHPAAGAALRREALSQAGPAAAPGLAGHASGPAGARLAGQRPRARGGDRARGHHQLGRGAADRRRPRARWWDRTGGRPKRRGGGRFTNARGPRARPHRRHAREDLLAPRGRSRSRRAPRHQPQHLALPHAQARHPPPGQPAGRRGA